MLLLKSRSCLPLSRNYVWNRRLTRSNIIYLEVQEMDSLTVRLMASSGKYSEAVDYWLEQLAESPAPTTISLGRESVLSSHSFGQVEQQLSDWTLQRVESLSKTRSRQCLWS